jgi:hypothetical protein
MARNTTPVVLKSEEVFPTLTDCLKSATSEVILVSPFISFRLLRDCLRNVPDHVFVTLVTKWDAKEIAAGFNDLETWNLFKDRGNCDLRLVSKLHAKYYRVDSQVLLGSGNLTHSGLNCFGGGNHEIMIGVDQALEGIREFEKDLLMRSTQVNEDRYLDALAVVQTLKLNQLVAPRVTAPQRIFVDGPWKPHCEMPDVLFDVYEGKFEALEANTIDLALADLVFVEAPTGLSKSEFLKYVRVAISQTPIFDKVLKEIELHEFVTAEVGMRLVRESYDDLSGDDVIVVWEASKRWLAKFFPEKFQIDIV